jgi:lactoylglutathione lyase
VGTDPAGAAHDLHYAGLKAPGLLRLESRPPGRCLSYFITILPANWTDILVAIWLNQQGEAVAKIIHTMIRVLDLDRSKAFYQQAFGLGTAHELDFEDFALVYLRNDENDMEIELTLNKGKTKAYKHGNGYGHVAMCVDDLDDEHERLAALGIEPTDIVEFAPGNNLLARFFFVTDPDGYEIEVLQRHGHYQ